MGHFIAQIWLRARVSLLDFAVSSLGQAQAFNFKDFEPAFIIANSIKNQNKIILELWA